MTRQLPHRIAFLAAAALSCATPAPTQAPVPAAVIDGYQWFAKRDCTAVRVTARTIDLPDSAPEREVFRLLEAYCVELEGNSAAAKELYESIVTNARPGIPKYEAALRLRELARLERRGVTRAELKQRVDEERASKSPRYDHGVRPVARMAPGYPPALLAAGIEGWVIIDFEISSEGIVIDPIVLDSDPPFIFEGPALNTIHDWIYVPFTREQPIRHMVRINFEIDDSRPSQGGADQSSAGEH